MVSGRAVEVMHLENVACSQKGEEVQCREEEKQGIRYDGDGVRVRDDDEEDEYVLDGDVGVHVGKHEEDVHVVGVYAG